eukprot:g4802.t1
MVIISNGKHKVSTVRWREELLVLPLGDVQQLTVGGSPRCCQAVSLPCKGEGEDVSLHMSYSGGPLHLPPPELSSSASSSSSCVSPTSSSSSASPPPPPASPPIPPPPPNCFLPQQPPTSLQRSSSSRNKKVVGVAGHASCAVSASATDQPVRPRLPTSLLNMRSRHLRKKAVTRHDRRKVLPLQLALALPEDDQELVEYRGINLRQNKHSRAAAQSCSSSSSPPCPPRSGDGCVLELAARSRTEAGAGSWCAAGSIPLSNGASVRLVVVKEAPYSPAPPTRDRRLDRQVCVVLILLFALAVAVSYLLLTEAD